MVARRSATPEVAYHDQLDGPPREASGPAPDLQADFPRSLASSKMAKIVDFTAFKCKLGFKFYLAAYLRLPQAHPAVVGQGSLLGEWHTVLAITLR